MDKSHYHARRSPSGSSTKTLSARDHAVRPAAPSPSKGHGFMSPTHYQLLRRLGAGGMGEAYLAERVARLPGSDEDLSASKVVLKVPIPEKLNDGGLEDIVREAKAVMGLNEQNVVRIEHISRMPQHVLRDFHDDPHEKKKWSADPLATVPFIEMEYLDGGPLSKFITKHQELGLAIPTQVIGYILYNVARGCDQAFNSPGPDGRPRRIVHRDLCPDNIGFIRNGVVKIMDYGIAVATGTKEASYLEGFAGKISFAAPEQIAHPYELFKKALSGEKIDEEKERRQRAITIASDIFTIGLIGYFMATFTHPFESRATASPIETLRTAMLLRQRQCPIIHPARKNGSLYSKNQFLNEILEKAMQYKPTDRYLSPEYLALTIYGSLLQEVVYSAFTAEAFRDYLSILDEVYTDVQDGIKAWRKANDPSAEQMHFERVRRTKEILDGEKRYDDLRYKKHLKLLYADNGELKKHPFTLL